MKIWWLNAQSHRNIKVYTIAGLNLFDGTMLKNKWVVPKIELIGTSYAPKDFIPLDTNTSLLVSQRVGYFLESRFRADIELLEYNEIKGKKYYILNVVNLIGKCLDLDGSIIIKDCNNNIQSIEKHVFNEELFSGDQIFKVKEHPDKIFVTDGFKRLIENEKFTGAEFVRSDITLKDLFCGSL